MKTLIVTGYTPDYEERAERFIESARLMGEKVEAVPYEDRGGWAANNRAKPSILCDVRAANPGLPLLWVDADSTMLAAFPKADCREWYEKYDFVGPVARQERYHRYFGSVLWFNGNYAGDTLLTLWRYGCRYGEGDGSEEFYLEWARRHLKNVLRCGDMPKHWTWLPRDGKPSVDAFLQIGVSGMGDPKLPNKRGH